MTDCVNRVRTDMVRVGPSNLLRGESRLFARETIIEGTVVASFGNVRELRPHRGHRQRRRHRFLTPLLLRPSPSFSSCSPDLSFPSLKL